MGSVWSTVVSSLHRLPVARELHLATRPARGLSFYLHPTPSPTTPYVGEAGAGAPALYYFLMAPRDEPPGLEVVGWGGASL